MLFQSPKNAWHCSNDYSSSLKVVESDLHLCLNIWVLGQVCADLWFISQFIDAQLLHDHVDVDGIGVDQGLTEHRQKDGGFESPSREDACYGGQH